MKNLKSTLLATSLTLFTGLAAWAQPTTLWTSSAGSADAELGGKSVTDGDGNTYVLSTFSSDVMLENSSTLTSSGMEDIMLIKMNSMGKVDWAKSMGASGADWGHDIAMDQQGNLLITGAFSEEIDFGNDQKLTSKGATDAFVLKMNKSGEVMWALQAGGSGDDQSWVVETDADGNVYVGGEFEGTDGFFGISPLIALGGKDMFVARIDSEGKSIWVTSMGGSDNEMIENLAVDAEGSMYVNGSFDGELVVGNDTLSLALGATFTTHIMANGTIDWTEQQGNAKTWLNSAMITDAKGNVYTAGSFEGTTEIGSETLVSEGKKDMVIVKQNAEGTVLWAVSAGGESEDAITSLAFDNDGSLVVGGYFESEASFGSMTKTSAGATDNVVAKLDAEGKFQWVITSGGTLNDKVNSIAVNSSSEIIATGTFEGTSSFKTDETSQGESDMYVWKIDQGTVGFNSEPQTQEIQVFPNPTSGLVTLKGVTSDQLVSLRITSVSGATVKTWEENTNINQIDLQDLETGVYVLTALTNDHELLTTRITKY